MHLLGEIIIKVIRSVLICITKNSLGVREFILRHGHWRLECSTKLVGWSALLNIHVFCRELLRAFFEFLLDDIFGIVLDDLLNIDKRNLRLWITVLSRAVPTGRVSGVLRTDGHVTRVVVSGTGQTWTWTEMGVVHFGTFNSQIFLLGGGIHAQHHIHIFYTFSRLQSWGLWPRQGCSHVTCFTHLVVQDFISKCSWYMRYDSFTSARNWTYGTPFLQR